jgi:hypothetical protein
MYLLDIFCPKKTLRPKKSGELGFGALMENPGLSELCKHTHPILDNTLQDNLELDDTIILFEIMSCLTERLSKELH